MFSPFVFLLINYKEVVFLDVLLLWLYFLEGLTSQFLSDLFGGAGVVTYVDRNSNPLIFKGSPLDIFLLLDNFLILATIFFTTLLHC